VEGYQAAGEELRELGLVVAELVDADPGDEDVPERLVDALFETVAL